MCLYILTIIVLFSVFSSDLQDNPTGQYLTFYKQTRPKTVANNKRYSHDNKRQTNRRQTTVFKTNTNGLPWFDEDVLGNRDMGQPLPLLQSSIINRRPALPRNELTRWKSLAGISRGFLGVYIKEFGFVPRAVYVENQSPRLRAPQPRVARDLTTIRPAPPYEDQTRLIFVLQKGDNSGKEAPQPRVDTIRGTFKC